MIDRRTFLRRLGFGTVAAAAAANSLFDVERLLWIPRPMIMVPATFRGANRIEITDWLAMEGLRLLEINLGKHFEASKTPQNLEMPFWPGSTISRYSTT